MNTRRVNEIVEYVSSIVLAVVMETIACLTHLVPSKSGILTLLAPEFPITPTGTK